MNWWSDQIKPKIGAKTAECAYWKDRLINWHLDIVPRKHNEQ